jgi:hypothetical protein
VVTAPTNRTDRAVITTTSTTGVVAVDVSRLAGGGWRVAASASPAEIDVGNG